VSRGTAKGVAGYGEGCRESLLPLPVSGAGQYQDLVAGGHPGDHDLGPPHQHSPGGGRHHVQVLVQVILVQGPLAPVALGVGEGPCHHPAAGFSFLEPAEQAVFVRRSFTQLGGDGPEGVEGRPAHAKPTRASSGEVEQGPLHVQGIQHVGGGKQQRVPAVDGHAGQGRGGSESLPVFRVRRSVEGAGVTFHGTPGGRVGGNVVDELSKLPEVRA
jgi:hypothetical protein